MRYIQLLLLSIVMWCASEVALADGNGGNTGDNQTPNVQEQLAAALARQKELEAEIEKLKSKPKDDPKPDPDDDDLRKKADRDRQAREEQAKETKRLEAAVQFNMSVDDFVKKNADLLPKEVSDIVARSHKETFDSAAAKANAIKSGIIQSYFSVQANVDALTSSHRAAIDEYLKLTKNGKEEKAPEVYANIFEPALETTRKVQRATEIARGRSGDANPSEASKAYKEKLIKGSRRQYLNEREA